MIGGMEKLSSKNRILAIVAILATSFAILFSSLFIAENLHHDCIGDDCPICQTLDQAMENIKTLGAAVIAAIAFVVSFDAVLEISANYSCEVIVPSLISQKVRMDN